MTFTRKYIPSYTVADYSQWQGDWELWEGVPVAMTPSPFGRHQQVLSRLLSMLMNQLDACQCSCDVLPELDWKVSENSVVRPDLMVICDGIPQRHLTTPPILIAEILSPSTAHKDRTAKFDLYEAQGVKHYLRVDTETNRVEVYSLSPAGKYEAVATDDSVPLDIVPGCQVRITPGKLFR